MEESYTADNNMEPEKRPFIGCSLKGPPLRFLVCVTECTGTYSDSASAMPALIGTGNMQIFSSVRVVSTKRVSTYIGRWAGREVGR